MRLIERLALDSQFFANGPSGLGWASRLDSDDFDQVDDPAQVIGFILFTRQTIDLYSYGRIRLAL